MWRGQADPNVVAIRFLAMHKATSINFTWCLFTDRLTFFKFPSKLNSGSKETAIPVIYSI